MKQSQVVESEQQARQPSAVAQGKNAYANASEQQREGFIDNRAETIAQRRLMADINVSPKMTAQRQAAESFHASPHLVAHRQQSMAMRSPALQLEAKPDTEMQQGKFAVQPEVAQRMEDEELLQGKFKTLQRVEEEELLQGKFKPAQRVEDEELMQGKFTSQQPAQLAQQTPAKPNNTSLPNNLKSGIESLSGMSFDNVKVHYNSSKPAQLNAHAYAQGMDIHLASGQEQHLPHEAWHVVQQAQGRVKPTMQMKAGVHVNDDQGLEREADVMGARAVQMVQPVSQSMDSIENVSAGVIQRVPIAGVNVTLSGSMPQWVQGGLTYHLNLTTDPPHVTCENWPAGTGKKKNGTTKMHFYYKGDADGITDAVSGQRGKKKFSDLPREVQTFVSNNYSAILAVT